MSNRQTISADLFASLRSCAIKFHRLLVMLLTPSIFAGRKQMLWPDARCPSSMGSRTSIFSALLEEGLPALLHDCALRARCLQSVVFTSRLYSRPKTFFPELCVALWHHWSQRGCIPLLPRQGPRPGRRKTEFHGHVAHFALQASPDKFVQISRS